MSDQVNAYPGINTNQLHIPLGQTGMQSINPSMVQPINHGMVKPSNQAMVQSTNQGAPNQSNQNMQQPTNQAQQPGNQVAQPGNQTMQPMGNQTIPQINQNGQSRDTNGQTYGQMTTQPQQMYQQQQSQIPQQMQGIAQQAMGLEDFNTMDPHGTIKMNLVQPQNPMMIPGFGNNANRYGANMNQNNIPMNGINANILNNLMELTGKPVQVPVDIVTVKSWSEAVKSVQTEEMVKDLNEIKNMNLTDDEDYLFNMYVHSPGLSDQLTLVSFLGGLYEAKYSHLFEKYNSLIMWLYYVLYQSICRGLKNVVEDNSTHKEEISKNTFSKFITRKSLKRKMASHAKEMSGPSVPKIFKTNIEQPNILEGKKHIFYTTSVYTGNPEVFTIGKFINQLLPSDFAILSSSCTFRKSNIAMGNNAAEMVNCGHIAFAQPILVQMFARSVRTYVFVGASNVEKLINAVKAMVNLECINGLTIGTLKEQTMSNLDVGHDKVKFDMNLMKEPDRIMCCVLSYVRCSMNNQRSVEIKGYASNFYALNQRYLKSPENEARLAKIVEENEEKMVQQLDAYNKARGFYVDDSDDDGPTESTETEPRPTTD